MTIQYFSFPNPLVKFSWGQVGWVLQVAIEPSSDEDAWEEEGEGEEGEEEEEKEHDPPVTSSGSGKVKESEVEGLTEQSVEPMEVGKNENTGKTPKMPETPQTPETPAPSGNVPDKVGAGLPTETPASVATTVSAPSGVPAAGPGPWTLTRHVVFSKSFFINIYMS